MLAFNLSPFAFSLSPDGLNSHYACNMRVGIVINKREVLKLEVKQVLHIRVDEHLRQSTRVAGELQLHLLNMIEVDMRIAKGVHEVTCLQARHLRHHLQQQCIRCDIEWHTQEDIRRALVELQGQATISHIELKQGVARW